MKLIQLNAWGGKLQYQIPAFLEEEQPDIVCLQEVHDLKGPSGALFVTLNELQESGGFREVFMAPTRSFHYMNRNVDYGNAILTNFKIITKEMVFTKGQFKKDYDLLDSQDARIFQHAILAKGQSNFNVINYHGAFIHGTKAGNEETMRHMDKLYDYIQKLKGPIILTGDFNLTPTSNSLARLNANLRNLPVEYRLSSTYTQLNIHRVVCDYIFVNDLVKVTSFKAAENLVSDHKALILEFDV